MVLLTGSAWHKADFPHHQELSKKSKSLTFLPHSTAILMVGDITIDHLRMSIDTVMMADVHQLFLLQEHEKFQYFIMRCVKTQINFSVKIDYHPKAIISTTTKLSKFTVLYTATMKGGKQWLRTVTPPPTP